MNARQNNLATTIAEVVKKQGEMTMDRGRSFTGQPHTFFGDRGRQIVGNSHAPLRMRDVADCVARAWLDSSGRHALADSGQATYNDLMAASPKGYTSIDPMALIQNVCVEIEKAMGIFPNVPKLRTTTDGEIAEFNADIKQGADVTLTLDDGTEYPTRTRSLAWKTPGGDAVVLVVGKTGGYSIDRVRRRP